MNQRGGGYHFRPSADLKLELARRQELRQHARNFLLAGGLMAGHSDGELVLEEQEALIDALRELFDDPEGAIERLVSPEVALDLLQGSMAWLKDYGGERRMDLYRHLAAIVAADGVLAPDEARFMQNVAQGLGIPLDEALAVIKREFGVPEESP